jgi:hypothetical protein
MRMFKRLAVTVAAAGVLLGGAAGVVSAATVHGQVATAPVQHVTGGQTTLTTAPDLAETLIEHGIVPLATLPATQGASTGTGGLGVQFTFPVTPSVIGLAHLTGTINHSGGILLIAPATGYTIAFSDFVINIKDRLLTALVNGNPAKRVGLLSLNLAHAQITEGKTSVTASGIEVNLTSIAASTLNARFSTSLFRTGLELGTVTTLLNF